MCLHSQWIDEVPDETARVARAAFPKGTLYLTIRDQLGTVYDDSAFSTLFSVTGQPALAAWRLAWVTVLELAEGLSDRQAAEAVRSRIDWKYLLGLPLTDPGFHYSVLREFRYRLIDDGLEMSLLGNLLEKLVEKKLGQAHPLHPHRGHERRYLRDHPSLIDRLRCVRMLMGIKDAVLCRSPSSIRPRRIRCLRVP